MRHRAAADLARRERFFQFGEFRLLQAVNLVCYPADRRCANSEDTNKFRDTVPRRLPRDLWAGEAEFIHQPALNLLALDPEGRQRTDGSPELADQHPSLHFPKTLQITAELIEPSSRLETK